ncbi:two pore domain potassium channel family protein [Paraburkholderia sp. LEh10]|jgi:hypothetical protein|uniref:potassium channel family protein n=1 Tax=Paraburkholderia sp. LEh10 TaxID=2821353 RepID=UPI001AE2E4CC|nr:potassium channel family protein [Paraburkholderia sp. LEh10]MBP0593385.1 two pore domain potassium channel family protein [Paraburkholderia sp. LEh10]
MTHVRQLTGSIAPLRKANMAVLLTLLVISVFGVPSFTEPGGLVGRTLQDLLLSLILITGVVSATERPRAFLLITLVALAAITLRLAGWVVPAHLTLAIRDATTLVAVALITVIIGMNVFGPGKVTFDRIDGAIALYILLGVLWAQAYQLVSSVIPMAFYSASLHTNSLDRSIWIYFIFVTLTTAGYGDILPIAPQARSLTNLEALVGQLYPAIVLARLVSLHLAGENSGASNS